MRFRVDDKWGSLLLIEDETKMSSSSPPPTGVSDASGLGRNLLPVLETLNETPIFDRLISHKQNSENVAVLTFDWEIFSFL